MGIVLGALTCLIAIALILISVFKQTRYRSKKLTEDETLVTHESYYNDGSDDDEGHPNGNTRTVRDVRETASSPILTPLATDTISRPEQVSIAIQAGEHTVPTNQPVDRSTANSTPVEPYTPKNSIVYRRVPVPTAKVVVQQPTTKVMIVRVPNTAGELIFQPPKDLSFSDEDN